MVIMPSHVHMIISSAENKLEDIIRDMKSRTSIALKKADHRKYHRKKERMDVMDDGKSGKEER